MLTISTSTSTSPVSSHVLFGNRSMAMFHRSSKARPLSQSMQSPEVVHPSVVHPSSHSRNSAFPIHLEYLEVTSLRFGAIVCQLVSYSVKHNKMIKFPREPLICTHLNYGNSKHAHQKKHGATHGAHTSVSVSLSVCLSVPLGVLTRVTARKEPEAKRTSTTYTKRSKHKMSRRHGSAKCLAQHRFKINL